MGTYEKRCWAHGGHGSVNFYTAISRSCDVFFYGVGRKLGINRLADVAFAFGLGSRTGVDLPSERIGTIPNEEWKWRRKREKWQPGDTVNCAIGQGDIETTPLQMALVASAIANNGKVMQPHMLREIRSSDGKVTRIAPKLLHTLPVSQTTIAQIKKTPPDTLI